MNDNYYLVHLKAFCIYQKLDKTFHEIIGSSWNDQKDNNKKLFIKIVNNKMVS